ncbi:MAG: hypothetical protein WBP14_02165 [Candidatus Saccharimonas aalborgensis]
MNMLGPELVIIREKIDELVATIDSDVISRGVFYGGIAVEAKGKKIPDLLQAKVTKLLETYHSKKNVAEINKFLLDECNRITMTFTKHSYSLARYDEFDRRINNLVHLVSQRAVVLRQRQRKFPDWFTTLIITVIAGCIVVAATPFVIQIMSGIVKK